MIERSCLRLVVVEGALAVLFFGYSPHLGILVTLIIAFTLFFFRDPPREIQEGVVAPADGKIDYIHGRRMEIFMGPFDCHINRSPVAGVVLRTRYMKGVFPPAYRRNDRAERNEILIEAEDGVFKVVQVAGFLARRIVCYIGAGDIVRKGQRIGIIKFGSRTVIEIPEGYEFVRKVGEKVKAGETVAVKSCSAYCEK